MVNNLIREKNTSWIFSIIRYWRKPFFSLFIYHVFDKLKLTYVLTKLLSYVAIIGILFSFADVKHDPRVAGLIILGVITAHTILIYQQHRFELTYLSMARNFPYSIGNLYINYVLSYLVLLLPESIWLFLSFNAITAIGLLLLSLSLVLLFHCLLYKLGLAMNKYLPLILSLFILNFCLILFGLMWLLMPVCILVSFIVFYLNYYKAELNAGI